jgi:hypothetical protein
MAGKMLGIELRSAGILNYDAANMIDNASWPCLVQRLRRVYAASYNEKGCSLDTGSYSGKIYHPPLLLTQSTYVLF